MPHMLKEGDITFLKHRHCAVCDSIVNLTKDDITWDVVRVTQANGNAATIMARITWECPCCGFENNERIEKGD